MKCILCGGYIPDGERVTVRRQNREPYYVRREVCEKCAKPEKNVKKKRSSIDLEIFSTRLTKLYKQSGKTLKELAIDIDLANSSLRRYKNGECQPNIDFIVNAATYFGVTTDYLLCMPGTDDEPLIKNAEDGVSMNRIDTYIICKALKSVAKDVLPMMKSKEDL